MKKLIINVSNRTVIRTLVLVLATMALYVSVRHIGHTLELIVIAAFLTLAAHPLTVILQKKLRFSRLMAVSCTFIILISLIGLLLFAVIPPLIQEIIRFLQTVPDIVNNAQSGNNWLAHILQNINLQGQLRTFVHDATTHSQQYGNLALNTLTKIGSSIVELISLLILIFLMLLEGPYWVKRSWALHSESFRERYQPVLKHMQEVVVAYVNGQILISIIGGLIALLPLLLLHIPNAVALAAIIAITGLIPLIGHPLGAGIVVITVLLISLPKALIMLAFFVIYLQLENISLQPYIQSKKNELTPLTVFVSALVGIQLAGILGAFLMIPLVACVRILLIDYLAHHQGRLEP